MTIAPGTKLGRYEIRSKIGAGGMGEVYLAEDVQLQRKVAIKVLPADVANSQDRMRRFEQEARAASALNHPNIITIHEIDTTVSGHYIATEYIEGETLRERLRKGRMKLSEALDIASQVASALAAAHAKGILHRDIKPENLMIRDDHIVKVLDFGLAKLSEPPEVSGGLGIDTEAPTRAVLRTDSGIVMGTVHYMSPEQARAQTLDARTDIWSLGVVLYEMVAGHVPFRGETRSHTVVSILEQEPASLTGSVPDVPPELQRIVRKALTKDRDSRYQTVRDLMIDLKNLQRDLDIQSELRRSHSSGDGSEAKAATDAAAMAPRATQVDSLVATQTTSARPSWFNYRLLVAVAAIAFIAIAGWFVWSRAKTRWARAQLPRIEELANAGKYFEAYDLAESARRYLPDDPTIARLMPTISQTISVTTDPAGADVYLKRFAPDAKGEFPPHQFVGQTPIKDLRVARGEYILEIQKEGYTKIEQTLSGVEMRVGKFVVMPPPAAINQKLFKAGQIPDRTVFVPGGDYRLVAWARPTDTRVHLDDFFIDKYEVSNQEYKEFINAGGYLKKQYWTYPFVKDGKTLAWEDAMKEFRDRTGLPGPRSWSSQNFPEGKANYPVTDVSWYEAAAYAAFRGKQLPTIFQWEKAARNGSQHALATYMPWGVFHPGDPLAYHANFNTSGTQPVDSSEFGMSPFGAYNMAGNVSEWCLNETSQGVISAGGGWGEPVYTFADYGAYPANYSSEKLGFRCVTNTPTAKGDQGGARIEINEEIPVYARSTDSEFNEWLKAYQYEKTALDPQIVEVKETAEWRREKITFNGADNERAIGYLYVPKNFPRPLQIVHFVPPSDVEMGQRPLPDAIEDVLAPTIKSGRAVFGVVIKGYIERLRPEGYQEPDPKTVEYREKIVNWVTDLRRGLDYLETRNDIDAQRIAFFGPSAGARTGLIVTAVDNRYASIFFSGAGVRRAYADYIPEASTVKFAPHIRAPKMMFQGRYDESLPLKTTAEPLFKLLPDPKRMILYDGGHVPPFELMVQTMTAWFDETMGQVKRE